VWNAIRSLLVAAPAAVVLAPSSAPSPTFPLRAQLGQSHPRPSHLTLALAAAPGELEITLQFPPTDSGNAPIAALELAKGTTRSVIESLTQADFANPPPGVEILPLAPTDSSYLDPAVSEGVDYYYKLHGCDGAVPPTCALSNVAKGTAGPLPVTFYLGTEELIFDAPPQSCSPTSGFDISDVPARAVRRSDGSILLVCGNSRGNFFDEGPDFNSLTRNCSMPAPLDSNFANDPALFDYQLWVFATYRDPASVHPNRIHALLHHEYHDTVDPPCDTPGTTCQYTSIEYAYSDDGGHSYFEPPLPTRLVAAMPYPWDPNLTLHAGKIGPWPFGYFLGSNIFKGVDGYTYAFVATVWNPIQPTLHTYMTLMRTADLDDPLSWRFWDGSGFGHQTRDPYVNGVSYETAIADPAQYFAAAIDPNLTGISGSITYNTYLQKYMMVSQYGKASDGIPCGFYFALSNDLIHWSVPRMFRAGNLSSCDPNAPQDVYPSVIDHQDASTNFEYADDTFDLYFSHYTTDTDRDLVRVPVRITHP
jgi:hypothetical protein